MSNETGQIEKVRSETDVAHLAFDRVTTLWKERIKQWTDRQQSLSYLMRRRLASGGMSSGLTGEKSKTKDWRLAPSLPPFAETADAAVERIPLTRFQEGRETLQNGSSLPQRMRLRTRKSRKCDQCDKFLIKPETKMNSTAFKIRSMAMYLCLTLDGSIYELWLTLC